MLEILTDIVNIIFDITIIIYIFHNRRERKKRESENE